MTPVGIEPAIFRFVAQHLNHCATACPNHITTLKIQNVKESTILLFKLNNFNPRVIFVPKKWCCTV